MDVNGQIETKRRPGRYDAVTFRAAKLCPKCKVQDPPCGFGRNRYRPDGLADYCASCRQIVAREQGRKRHAKYNATRKGHPADDGARYAAPAPTTGAYPCKAKNCEYDEFTTPEALECHVRMRHGEPAA